MSESLPSLSSVDDLLSHVPDAEQRLADMFKYLQASERLMQTLINEAKNGKTLSAPPHDAEGGLEFGLMLHWLHHPNEEHKSKLSALNTSDAAVMSAVRQFAPPSVLTPSQVEEFVKTATDIGWVNPEGILWALGWYTQLDPLWVLVILNYAINVLFPFAIYQPFPSANQAYKGTGNTGSKIAIIGDWGTGAYGDKFGGSGPAMAVIEAVKQLKPDYVMHLGDVYYCGTNNRPWPNEIRNNFLTPWEEGVFRKERSFTINANHEMYGGGHGLMKVALGEGTPFAHQNHAPYFALEFPGVVMIGLDSAYFDPSMFYSLGALGNADNTQQKEFIKSLGNISGKKVMVMTHHNPMSFDGEHIVQNTAAGQSLWDGMVELLGRQPDVWYWGHLHLGVAYNAKSALGAKGVACRCIGHSAIPFGDAYGINTDMVDYYAHTPITPGSIHAQNGFAMLTMGNGMITEEFYEVTNTGGYELKHKVVV